MKTIVKFWVIGAIAITLQVQTAFGQKIDDERMRRDIEVAENVLGTLIKQEINQQRNFYGIDINGTYQEGYGVTFRIPGNYSFPMVMIASPGANNTTIVYSDDESPKIAYQRDKEQRFEKERGAYDLKQRAEAKRKLSGDSLRDEYNKRVIQASKDFILDYGDMISQLSPTERIVVTNRGEARNWYYIQGGGVGKRSHISVEGLKGDITAFRQGKLSREQALAKLKVVNTETVEEKEKDMELLSTIFNRLYHEDLSTTYFVENNIYFERLKDYGVIFYMNVSSSYRDDFNRHRLPTQNMDDVDEQARNKKVAELYPKFETDLQESMLEYGRTLTSLKPDEVLMFNVTLTKCKGCGIPSTLELSVKESVLKDFGTGALDKATALTKFTIKKGPNQ